MLGGLTSQILVAVVITSVLPNGLTASDISGAFCRQIYMSPPRIGERCITETEVYRNYPSVPQERCMWQGLRDPSCTVINYNAVDMYCLLGQGTCVSLEPESGFIAIPLTMQEPCLTWVRQDAVPPTLDNVTGLVIYQVQTGNLKNNVTIARAIWDSSKVPGKQMHYGGFFSWNGMVEEFSTGNYEILIASPRCDLSWVNYNPASGNVLPDGAVIGGHHNGRQLYVARKGDRHRGQPFAYAAGYYDNIAGEGEVTYGDHVIKFTEMEILVVHG